MIMKTRAFSRIHRWLIGLCLALLPLSIHAQCGIDNFAFKSGEFLSYDLFFNWKFVWVKVGTASMSTVQSSYKGQKAFRSSLITRGNDKLDNIATRCSATPTSTCRRFISARVPAKASATTSTSCGTAILTATATSSRTPLPAAANTCGRRWSTRTASTT